MKIIPPQQPHPETDAGSFRDRTNRVFIDGQKVYRLLSSSALEEWGCLRKEPFFTRMTDAHKIIGTRQIDFSDLKNFTVDDAWVAALEHERIPVISYPYEWPFGMLKDAALLHLDILQETLNAGMILKDATPFNVQWKNLQPCFIDVGSFQKYQEGHPWAAYQQFCRLFLYPLIIQSYKNINFQPLLRGYLDGIPSDQIRSIFSLRDWLRPGVLFDVVLQSMMENKFSNQRVALPTEKSHLRFGREMILKNVRRLEKVIMNLTWSNTGSPWANYLHEKNYGDQDYSSKKTFVEESVKQQSSLSLVWDMGCNVGEFSEIASRYSDSVVAMDGDPWVVELFYQRLKKSGVSKNILPLVINLSDGSPGMGWRGLERKRLEERGRPQLILCLALLHHLVISANIPLLEVISWLASLEGNLVIEFVDKSDTMVQRLLQNKLDNYDDYERGNFEVALKKYFVVEATQVLSEGRRVLYRCTHKQNL